MSFDLPLAVEMRDAGITVGTANRAVDEVVDANGFGDIGNDFPLTNLAIETGRKEVLDGKDCGRPVQSFPDGRSVIKVPFDDFRAQHFQLLYRRLLAVMNHCTNVVMSLIPLSQQLSGNRTTLVTTGACHHYQTIAHFLFLLMQMHRTGFRTRCHHGCNCRAELTSLVLPFQRPTSLHALEKKLARRTLSRVGWRPRRLPLQACRG